MNRLLSLTAIILTTVMAAHPTAYGGELKPRLVVLTDIAPGKDRPVGEFRNHPHTVAEDDIPGIIDMLRTVSFDFKQPVPIGADPQTAAGIDIDTADPHLIKPACQIIMDLILKIRADDIQAPVGPEIILILIKSSRIDNAVLHPDRGINVEERRRSKTEQTETGGRKP